MDIRRILAPTDFSEYSKQAVTYAHELAQTFGARLLLLRVVEPPVYPAEVFLPSTVGTTLIDDLERQARLDLAKLLPKAEHPRVDVMCLVAVGSPYYKILEVAGAEKVDLIVMATHGRTGLGHLVMGSVAERVVRMAPCPIMTISPMAMTGEHGHAPLLRGSHTAGG
jgi:universal stress protein A